MNGHLPLFSSEDNRLVFSKAAKNWASILILFAYGEVQSRKLTVTNEDILLKLEKRLGAMDKSLARNHGKTDFMYQGLLLARKRIKARIRSRGKTLFSSRLGLGGFSKGIDFLRVSSSRRRSFSRITFKPATHSVAAPDKLQPSPPSYGNRRL